MKSKSVQVVVGVIRKDNQVLIAKRSKGQHLEGFWEFPGGKIEIGESEEKALARELEEELAINVVDSTFLFDLEHEYPKKNVRLSIYLVEQFSGVPTGAEGQPVVWCDIDRLPSYTFPPANAPIIKYLCKK